MVSSWLPEFFFPTCNLKASFFSVDALYLKDQGDASDTKTNPALKMTPLHEKSPNAPLEYSI